MLGKSGKNYFNPKVMAHHGDEPSEGEGHPSVHHIEIHPHGPSSEHPHHAEAHGHDGEMTHLGEHANYDEAAMAGKAHMDGGEADGGEGMQEEEHEQPMHMGQVRKSDSGAY